jgi:hypothetical protein
MPWFFTIDLPIHRDLNQLPDIELQPLAKASNQKSIRSKTGPGCILRPAASIAGAIDESDR